MKILNFMAIVLLTGCVGNESRDSAGGEVIWTVGKYESSISHTPSISGYRKLKSEAVEFRKYRVHHPTGLWFVRLDGDAPPIEIKTAKHGSITLSGEWYPEEGGADAAAVYAFVKGSETLIILQGTSDLTYEETWVTIVDGKTTDLKRYAAKGDGMGPEMPGVEPKYRVYPES
ncbi:hypothetical protein ACFSSA_12430 [Luteolibacter algae]|uniref:Lipocalin-like domain-containing protein n=1 Tax=Luteolibacter algae TaxID=454151 RepID=A0ABW5DCT1_9BACT